MSSGNVIRGSRVGAGPTRWDERAERVPRRTVGYWCANGHETSPVFAVDVKPPELWDCPHCGEPAGQDAANPPVARAPEPYKTHLAYVKERRSPADAAALLEEALAARAARRRP